MAAARRHYVIDAPPPLYKLCCDSGLEGTDTHIHPIARLSMGLKSCHREPNSTRRSVHHATFVHALREKYLLHVKEEFTDALLLPPTGELPTTRRNQLSSGL